MPERLRIKEMIVTTITGEPWHYGDGDEQFDGLPEAADDLYLTIVDRIDWNRILLMAAGRCLHKGHTHVTAKWEPTHVCGDSIRDAMCSEDYAEYGYKGKDRYVQPRGIDWARAFYMARRKYKMKGKV